MQCKMRQVWVDRECLEMNATLGDGRGKATGHDSCVLEEELQVFDVEARRGAKNTVASVLFSQWE